MKRIIQILTITAAITVNSGSGMAAGVKRASDATPDIKVTNAVATRNGELITVSMNICLDSLKVNRNREIVLRPALATENDTLRLDPVTVYGSTRWNQMRRTGYKAGADQEISVRSGSKSLREPLQYNVHIPYSPELEGAELIMLINGYGCCNHYIDRAQAGPFASLQSPREKTFDMGEPVWITPDMATLAARKKNTKNRELTGSAFIDFPVNKTEIYPLYRNNRDELARIRKTLDVVITDPDVKVEKISIKGYASPEGSYTGNERLASGRTEALRAYLRDYYRLPDSVFHTDHEAEDWEGLRRAVDTLDIASRHEILNIIDSGLDPDAKDAAIKTRYPNEYATLLRDIYPALRHSDYRIDYLVRDYEGAAVIEAVMNRDASKLSPEEFRIASAAHEPGSPEFIAINALCLSYYPDDPVANYNMAVSALRQKDPEAAAKRLAKVPDGPEKRWALGKLEELRESLGSTKPTDK
ncbi:MAG: DUF3868 domain-containing protein [Muribaculaceae bacterium]|nr:DUF3868 domain-containing protein [Muribaculaceae bacterium]